MDTKSAFDILVDILIELGLKPFTHVSDRNFLVPGSDRLLNTKYVVAQIDASFFLAYDSYGTKANSSLSFTGIYSSIELMPAAECKISKKHWLDQLITFNKRKTGIPYIDESLTITSSAWTPSQLLKEEDVKLMLTCMNKLQPLKFIIQNDYMPLLYQLKEQKIIGLETNEWLYEKKGLETLLFDGSKLLNNLKKAATYCEPF
ncbi:MAG: hypothetical protein WCO13_05365 [Bacteroidota bacterium]